jgi:hypothetical protein
VGAPGHNDSTKRREKLVCDAFPKDGEQIVSMSYPIIAANILSFIALRCLLRLGREKGKRIHLLAAFRLFVHSPI